ncbi:MAG: hypothetical protein M3432_06760 [Chloroflexota bacterium]|nr:hypothetical protein [Chloroflexota bacterium]
MTLFEIHGHRGVPSLMPENTLEGFELAIAMGATALELDVTLSADGVVIVSHEPIADPNLYRHRREARAPVAGRGGHVLGRPWSKLSMEQVATLDAGAPGWLGPGTDPFRKTRRAVDGARVPTLDAVFYLARRLGAGHLRFEIEVKRDPTSGHPIPGPFALARGIATVVRLHRMTSRSRLRSFDWSVLVAARRVAPELAIVALIRGDTASRGSAWLSSVTVGRGRWAHSVTAAARGIGAVAVAPEHSMVDAELMAGSTRAGLAVLPWTVNSPERAGELMALGVSGLTTDRPGVLRDLIAMLAEAPQRSLGSSR